MDEISIPSLPGEDWYKPVPFIKPQYLLSILHCRPQTKTIFIWPIIEMGNSERLCQKDSKRKVESLCYFNTDTHKLCVHTIEQSPSELHNPLSIK